MAPPPKKQRIKYVFIPVDESQPMEELEIEQPEGKEVECLTNAMQEHYRKFQSQAASEEGRVAFRKNLEEKIPANMITDAMLDGAFGMQLVESVPLMAGGPHSEFIHVNLYCDDKGSIKKLPVNARAGGLADACGKPSQVYGDAFVGRIYESVEDFWRLDFTLKELDSGAQWMQAARTFNINKSQNIGSQMQDFAKTTGASFDPASLQTTIKDKEDIPVADTVDPGDTPGAYTWTQSSEEVVISVGCPKGTTAKAVTCKIRPGLLTLAIASLPEPAVFTDLPLFAKVQTDESTWCIEDVKDKRILSITLTKDKNMRWLDLKTATAS